MCLRRQLSGFYSLLLPWVPGTKIQSSCLHGKFFYLMSCFPCMYTSVYLLVYVHICDCVRMRSELNPRCLRSHLPSFSSSHWDLGSKKYFRLAGHRAIGFLLFRLKSMPPSQLLCEDSGSNSGPNSCKGKP